MSDGKSKEGKSMTGKKNLRCPFSILLTLLFLLISCESGNNNTPECITGLDCPEGFICIDGYCVDDGIGDTGNSGNTGDTGNSGDTGDSGNSGNSGDTAIPDEDTVIVDNEIPDIVNDDNVEHDDDVNPEQDDDVVPDEDNAITCDSGYESNGTNCVDINECVKGTHNCNVNADCANTEGSFTCTCKTNYSGNGVSCTPDTRSNQACSGLPENAQWNTAAVINQTWNGSDWIPSTIGTYNVDLSLTECRFICKTNFGWNGSVCIAELRYDQACTGLPSNASWNTASSITQAWSGSTWLPTTTGVYNETASDAECRYKCNADYHWDISSCVSNTRTNQTCTGLPANASWNTVSVISQTWNGSAWMPATNGTYNETSSTTECRYTCNGTYHWDGSACISDTKTMTCAAKPANTDWNTVSSYTQTWNGSAWSPVNSTTAYNTTGSTTECRYQCSSDFYWNNSACVQCTDNTHCSDEPGTLYCNTGNNTCVQCLVDANCSTGYMCSNYSCVLGCDSVTAAFNGSWTDSKGNNWTTNCSGTGCTGWILNHTTYTERAVHQPDGNAETSTSYLVSPQYTRKSGCSLTLTYDYRVQENSTTSDWLKLEVCTGSCSSWTTIKTWNSNTSSILGEVSDISSYVPAGANFKVRWAHYSPKVTYHYAMWVDSFIINGI